MLTIIAVCAATVLFGQGNKRFFEGTVTYDIEYTPLKKEVTVENLNKHFGSKLIFSTRSGFTKKCFYDGTDTLLETRIFDPNSVLNSRILKNRDTVYQYHPSNNVYTTLALEELPDTVIDGSHLEGIKIVMKITKSKHGNPISIWYYFDKELRTDPKYFSKFTEGDWNKIIKMKKAIATYYVIDNGFSYIARYKAVKIEHQSFDPKIFDIPKNFFPKNID